MDAQILHTQSTDTNAKYLKKIRKIYKGFGLVWFGLVYLYRSLSIQFIPTKDSSAQSPPYNMEIKAKLSNTKHCII